MTAIRYDGSATNQIYLDSSGILRCNATLARVGTQVYLTAKGIIREFRPPEEVEKSASSFSSVPITLDHPSEQVTSDNADLYSKGLTGTCTYNNGVLQAQITVTHKDAIERAMSTHRQISCGYTCDLENTPGVWVDADGLVGAKGAAYEYDAIQRNIKSNHVALVERGRAGAIASLHLDSDNVAIAVEQTNVQPIDRLMKIQILSGKEILTLDGEDSTKVKALVDKQEAAIDSLQAKLDAANAEVEQAKAKVTSLEADLTATKDRADSATTDINAALESPEAKARVATGVADLLKLWHSVLPKFKEIKGDSYEPDYSLDANGVRKEYLKAKLPTLAQKIDSASSDYLAALWDMATEAPAKKEDAEETREDSTKELLETIKANRPTSKVTKYDGSEEMTMSSITERRKNRNKTTQGK